MSRSTELGAPQFTRRMLIAAIGGSATIALSGCLEEEAEDNPEDTGDDDTNPEDSEGDDTEGDTNGEESQTGVADVNVRSEDYARENAVLSITIRYATNTVGEFDPPDSSTRSAASGQKFVIVHAEITVDSELDDNIDVYGSAIGLDAEGIIEDGRSIHDALLRGRFIPVSAAL